MPIFVVVGRFLTRKLTCLIDVRMIQVGFCFYFGGFFVDFSTLYLSKSLFI